ncbi:NRDE family protein [Alteromonas lipolytica]|uniref:NRDE family protein n=1 Tax=Alteromonas lipolytica TaxID=1856405 RepID=A0A1E8FIW1_9ALTE|nr:NRDE family protein [Alteromonas lipolytica]OFI35877.1 hypothetical protein BFC17_11420 [Alteromonas lipolytica]GGF81585.1 hypothetical protein GCM10011338_37320 [Alteromonas lipolytica]
MCIIFVALNQHPQYPLIIAANRDEFYQRPTQPSHWWQSPPILAGKDLSAGGSWMGMSRSGHIAALTNIRDPNRVKTQVRSRGELVVDYLRQTMPESQFSQELAANRDAYNGYNLLFGHLTCLQVYHNHSNSFTRLENGFHGLSNAALNTPWPKITRGITALSDYIGKHTDIEPDTLFALLADNTLAARSELPDTGVPLEWEQRLSSIFIRSEEYGTRSSTLVLLDHQYNVSWLEREFNHSNTDFVSRQFNWKIVQE